MNGKVAIVTGANTGIGLETARGLLAQGATVVLACRDQGKGEKARDELIASTGNKSAVVMRLDLANLPRIKNFATKFEATYPKLDLLVNNAGLWPRTRRKTEDGFEMTFGVNYLGPFYLTHLLRPALERGAPSRIVVLTSSLHFDAELDFDDPMFKVRKHRGSIAYGQSKLANVMFSHALARRLEGRGVTVNAVHPGVVTTELNREAPPHVSPPRGQLSAADGAKGSLHLATSPALEGVSGRYFEGIEEKESSAFSRDVAAQERLWALSLSLLKLPPES